MTHLPPMEFRGRSSAPRHHPSSALAHQEFWSISTLDAASNNYIHNSHSFENVRNNFVLERI
jgi:hypothetical protein